MENGVGAVDRISRRDRRRLYLDKPANRSGRMDHPCRAELHIRLNNAGWQSSVAWRALHQLAAAVIVTDREARIVGLNRAGEDLLSQGRALSVRQGRLCAARTFETAKLRAAIGAAAVSDERDPAIGRMLVKNSDGACPMC